MPDFLGIGVFLWIKSDTTLTYIQFVHICSYMAKTKCDNCGLFCTDLKRYESEYSKEVDCILPSKETKTEWEDIELRLCGSCYSDFPEEFYGASLSYYKREANLSNILSEKLYNRVFE